MTVFGEKAVLHQGMARLRGLVARHGITSPEVMEGVTRWGRILDETREQSNHDGEAPPRPRRPPMVRA